MFLDFYGLRQQPFGVTPDPTFLFPSRTHCEALDALTAGIQDGRGFMALVAQPGMGKTTLLYQLLDALRDKARTVFLFQTQCDSREFFQYLLSELGVDSAGMGLVAMHTKLNEMLFAELMAGRRFVLVVDEAQNLGESVLETVRLLSNFETPNTKLLQIVLAGQPELGEKLAKKELAQLLQRITVVKYLDAFSPEETAAYIHHRLKIAGRPDGTLFEPGALAVIAEQSGGVPRNINRICFEALSRAHAEGRSTVSCEIAELASREFSSVADVRPSPTPVPPSQPTRLDSAREVATGAAPTTGLTYTPLAGTRMPRWARWTLVGGLVAVALGCLGISCRGRIGTIRARVSARMSSFLQRKNHEDSFLTWGIGAANSPQGSARTSRTDLTPTQVHDVIETAGYHAPSVTSIEAANEGSGSRVVVTLDGPVEYDSARITSPTRVYFDLHDTQLGPSVAQKTMPAEMGLLTAVRTAQYSTDVVRLVLDADGAKDYSAQLFSNPYRLVIDLHAESTAIPQHPTSLTRELGLKIDRIVIDAGHGGYDTGTIGPHGLLEKDLCLDVALRLGRLLQENLAGAEVIYTRQDDRYVPLEERAMIANNANADLFVSVHANSSDSSRVRGVETYYLSLAASQGSMEVATRENALAESRLHELPELVKEISRNEKVSQSKQLARDIQSSLSRKLQLDDNEETNRGVKRAPFIVLTGANMPAVLSEISFVSNASDEALLLQTTQRERVAEGLYRGIAAYLNALHGLPQNPEKLVSDKGGAPSALQTTSISVARNSQSIR